MSQQAAVIRKAEKKSKNVKIQNSNHKIRKKNKGKNIILMLSSWLMLYACVRMQVARLRAVFEL